jgi:hypothetical protein
MKTNLESNLVEALATFSTSKKDLERRVKQAGIGVMAMLRDGGTTIAQAERDLFNFDTYVAAKRRRLSKPTLEFLEWGMELSSVADLAPRGLSDSFTKMEQLLSK